MLCILVYYKIRMLSFQINSHVSYYNPNTPLQKSEAKSNLEDSLDFTWELIVFISHVVFACFDQLSKLLEMEWLGCNGYPANLCFFGYPKYFRYFVNNDQIRRANNRRFDLIDIC